jgi:uncharacterized protein (TIGR03437 family)
LVYYGLVEPWILRLLAFALLPLAALAQTPTANDFFDDSVLHEIRLGMHPSDWTRLRRDFQSNDYYSADMTWRGITIREVGIRSRGFGSRNGMKPGLRVDFNRFEEEQEFLGLKSFVLKPNVQDPSQMHERLAMLFYPALDLPAPREAHGRLIVNGEYAGLYAIVESIDKRYLKRIYNEEDGYLYQYEWNGPYRFEYLGSETSRYVPSPFQPQTHERDPEAAVLVSMIREMNQASDGDFARVIGPYIDLKQFMTHLAVETFLAEADGILAPTGMANFWLYRFEKKNLFHFLVWDKDRSFADPEQAIFRNFNDNVLARRALAVSEARRAFLEGLQRCAILAGGAQGWLEYQIDRIYGQIQNAAYQDPNKLCPDAQGALQLCTNLQFEQGVTKVREFAAQRSDFARRAVSAAGYQLSGSGPRLRTEGGPLTPGSLLALYGERLAETDAQATALPLPNNLFGVSVFINGFPAPLLYVSPNQINLQIPWELGGENVPVTVVLNGIIGNTINFDVGQSAPVVYGIRHSDGAPVAGERAARAGDILVIRCTGLGPVNGSALTGRPAPAEPLMRTRELPVVRAGGVGAEVLFSGLAPGLVGVYQMNVRLGAGTPVGGQTPVTIAVGSQVSAPFPIATRD